MCVSVCVYMYVYIYIYILGHVNVLGHVRVMAMMVGQADAMMKRGHARQTNQREDGASGLGRV